MNKGSWFEWFELDADPFSTSPISRKNVDNLFYKTEDTRNKIDPQILVLDKSLAFTKLLVGPRGIGKSSIFHYIELAVEKFDNIIPIYIDITLEHIGERQDIPIIIGESLLNGFLRNIIIFFHDNKNNLWKKHEDFFKNINKQVGYTIDTAGLQIDPFVKNHFVVLKTISINMLRLCELEKIRPLLLIDNLDKDDKSALEFLGQPTSQSLFEIFTTDYNSMIYITCKNEIYEKMFSGENRTNYNYLQDCIILDSLKPLEGYKLLNLRCKHFARSNFKFPFELSAIHEIVLGNKGITRDIINEIKNLLIRAHSLGLKTITIDDYKSRKFTKKNISEIYHRITSEDPSAKKGSEYIMSLYTFYGNNISRYLSAINLLIKIHTDSKIIKEDDVFKLDFINKRLIFFDQDQKLKIQNNIRILFDKLKDNDIDLNEFKNWFAETKIEEIDLTPVSEQFESNLLKLKRNIEICQINSVTESYLDMAKSYSSEEVRKIIIANLDSSLQEYLRLRNEEWDNLTSIDIFNSLWNSIFYYCKALTFHIASFFNEDLYFGLNERRHYWDNIFYFIIHKAGKEFRIYINNWPIVTELYKLRFKVITEKSYEPSIKELEDYYSKINVIFNELTDIWLRMIPNTDVLSNEGDIEKLVTCTINYGNLKIIISTLENQYVEFKEDLNIAEKFAKEMVAFANSNNGIILVGVTDDGGIKGVKDPSSIQAKIFNIASNNCLPAITPTVSIVKFGNIELVAVQVKKDTKVISDNNKKIWIRKGNISINPDTREIEDLFRRCNS